MGFKFRIIRPSRWTRLRLRTKSLVTGLELCPIRQKRLLKPSKSQRATKTKDERETGGVSHKLKAVDEAMAEEGKAMVGAEAKPVSTPIYRSSMAWTAKI